MVAEVVFCVISKHKRRNEPTVGPPPGMDGTSRGWLGQGLAARRTQTMVPGSGEYYFIVRGNKELFELSHFAGVFRVRT